MLAPKRAAERRHRRRKLIRMTALRETVIDRLRLAGRPNRLPGAYASKVTSSTPIDIALANLRAIAIVEHGGDAFNYVEAIGREVWCADANLSDEVEISRRLTATGYDAATVLDMARAADIKAIHARNTSDAIAADADRVPAYVLNGKVFFGQDRIETLEKAIIENRKPFGA